MLRPLTPRLQPILTPILIGQSVSSALEHLGGYKKAVPVWYLEKIALCPRNEYPRYYAEIVGIFGPNLVAVAGFEPETFRS